MLIIKFQFVDEFGGPEICRKRRKPIFIIWDNYNVVQLLIEYVAIIYSLSITFFLFKKKT